MLTGALLVLLALGAIALSALGRRMNAQPGLLILVVGAAVSFAPGLPRLELEPELILGLVVPPLLYAATLEVSFLGFMRNLRPILGLGVTLVVITMAVTGWTASLLLPWLGLAAAFVLASIVAPPDTVTITSHGDEIGLPRRVGTILTGESLVNDAAALTLFSVTVAWAARSDTFIANPVLLFGYSVVVGVLLGLSLGFGATLLRLVVGDPTLATAIGLLLPFAAFLAAEDLHASGVLAVVMAGFSVSLSSTYGGGGGRNGDDRDEPRNVYRLDHRIRLREGEVWPVVGSLLEAFAFAYTGLQLRFVLEELSDGGEHPARTVLAGLALVAVVVAVRLAWVFLLYSRDTLKMRLFVRKLAADARFRKRIEDAQAERAARGRRSAIGEDVLDWKETLLLGWTGMRGIVTLGAAAGIPLVTSDGAPFPHRTTLQFLAYLVVVATLLLQGPTLPWLARRLRIDTGEEDAAAARTLATAWAIADGIVPPERPGEPARYDQAREALSVAVRERRVDDESARTVLEHLDRRQAAFRTLPAVPPEGSATA